MQANNKRIPPLWKQHGGKYYLSRKIINLFPERKFEVFCDPTVAAGSITLNLNPSNFGSIHISDLNSKVTNAWIAVKDYTCAVYDIISKLPYTEEVFKHYLYFYNKDNSDIIIDAISQIVCHRFSRSGLCKDFAWQERLRGGIPGDANAWLQFVTTHFSNISNICSDWYITNCNARQCINTYNTSDCLLYLDPPYPKEVRVSKNSYGKYEMPTLICEKLREGQYSHEDLLNDIILSKAKIFISTYNNTLYQKILLENNWKIHVFPIANHSGQTKIKNPRIEVVYESP